MKFFPNPLRSAWIAVVAACLFTAGPVLASGDSDAETLERLESTIEMQQQQLEALRQQVEQLKEMATMADSKANQAMASASTVKEEKKYGITLYGSIRPALTNADFGDSSSTDVTDFLSRVGVKGEVAVRDGLTAFYRGEWDTDIEANGDLGDARLGYVGIKGSLGQIAIGKQWDPHFNIVAEVVDIFNHRSSPFGYDEASPFRSNQILTYSFSRGGFKLDSGIRFDGDPENGAGGNNSSASEPNHIDSASIGIGYRTGDVYAGVSYLDQQGDDDYERSFMGVAASWNVTDSLYVAATYQDIDEDNVSHAGHNDGHAEYVDYDQSSVDVAAALALGGGYKLKAAYFDWDGDDNGRSFDGYNLTLENQLSDSVRIFAEWLRRDIERGEEEDYLSIGMRYDFEANL